MSALRRLTILLLVLAVTAAGKEDPKEARVRSQVQAVLGKYLEARFRGAPWKEFSDLVMWSVEQEAEPPQQPACASVVRSYDIGAIRLAEKDRALANVTFYQLGTYCPAEQAFQPAPHLDNAVFQLRKRSIVWLVEKSSRPGGQLDWKVLREQLRRQLSDPALPTAAMARLSVALDALERAGNAIGETPAETQRAPSQAPQ